MSDELGWIKRAVESGMRVKLAPGVIGKASMMWGIVLVGWLVVLARLSPTAPWWFNLMLFGGVATVTTVMMRESGKMRDFAEKNPGTALLEGAELTEFTRVDAQAKGLLAPDRSGVVAGSSLTGTAPTKIIETRAASFLPPEPVPQQEVRQVPERTREDLDS